MAKRPKPDLPPGAAKKIAEALDDIDAPEPRKAAPKPRPKPRSARDAPVPARYRQLGYGTTDESKLAQAERLKDGNTKNIYGGATFDHNGQKYSVAGRSSSEAHAEGDMLDRMRQEIAAREGISPEDVDLKQVTKAKVFVEFSPCDTRPRRCQQLLDDELPAGTDVSYSWPWNPRDVRDASRLAQTNAVTKLFQRGTPGPIS
ncbi:hypothetical protein [Micromonospora inaquosa]|uniref:hypothetical protein n=1 Tax=Micromonospora inaquosa TaxID=2203716 RepID=UPI001AC006D0|nr:hypothetical protein [Micromonospora inaquosa]